MILRILDRYALGDSNTGKIHLRDPLVIGSIVTALCGTTINRADVVDPTFGLAPEPEVPPGVHTQVNVHHVINNLCQHCATKLQKLEGVGFMDQVYRLAEDARDKLVQEEAPKIKRKNISASEEVIAHLGTLRTQLDELSTEIRKRGVCGTEDVYTPYLSRLRYTLAAAMGYASEVVKNDPTADPRAFGSPMEQSCAPSLEEEETNELDLVLKAAFSLDNSTALHEVMEGIHSAIGNLQGVGVVKSGQLRSRGPLVMDLDVNTW